MRIFNIYYDNGRVEQLAAESYFEQFQHRYAFYKRKPNYPSVELCDAQIPWQGVKKIVPQDMIISAFNDTVFVCASRDTPDKTVNVFRDAFVSDDSSVGQQRFGAEEKTQLQRALGHLNDAIGNEYNPTVEQGQSVARELSTLGKYLDLTKVDFKRLLMTAIVTISVELGFGTLVPQSLIAIVIEALSQSVRSWSTDTKKRRITVQRIS